MTMMSIDAVLPWIGGIGIFVSERLVVSPATTGSVVGVGGAGFAPADGLAGTAAGGGCAARIIDSSSACGGGLPGLAGRLGRSEKHEPDLPGLGARLCWNRRQDRNGGIGGSKPGATSSRALARSS